MSARESDAQPLRGGSVAWLGDLPAPGQLVQVQVRDEALAALLVAGTRWRLTADGDEIPGQLEVPVPPRTSEITEVAIARHSNAESAEFSVVLDRGPEPKPINRLRLQFLNPSVRGLLRIEASASESDYRAVATEQIVYQQVVAGTVLRLTDLSCPVEADERYLRLTMPDGAGIVLDGAAGWLEPLRQYGMYELPAALGAMRALSETEHLWPLLLKSPSVPLAKIKLIADAPGSVRHMRATRLSDSGIPVATVASIVWADQITAGGISRSEKWLQIDSPGGDPRGWAIVVDDRNEQPLQLAGVQVYCAEVSLLFECPRTNDVTLWLEPPQLQRLTCDEAARRTAPVVGRLMTLELAREDVDLEPGTLPWYKEAHQLEDALARWQAPLLFGLGALAALVAGAVLLRRPQPGNDTANR